MSHSLPHALVLFFGLLTPLSAGAQSWIIGPSNSLSVAADDTEIRGDAGRVEITISRAVLLRAIANTFNANRSPIFDECRERLSGSWQIENDAESVLAFTARIEKWQCMTFSQPIFKGLVVRTEKKTIKTKLYSFEMHALLQVDVSVAPEFVGLHLTLLRTSLQNTPAAVLENIRELNSLERHFEFIEFNETVTGPAGPISGKRFEVKQLRELTMTPEGTLRFFLPL